MAMAVLTDASLAVPMARPRTAPAAAAPAVATNAAAATGPSTTFARAATAGAAAGAAAGSARSGTGHRKLRPEALAERLTPSLRSRFHTNPDSALVRNALASVRASVVQQLSKVGGRARRCASF